MFPLIAIYLDTILCLNFYYVALVKWYQNKVRIHLYLNHVFMFTWGQQALS